MDENTLALEESRFVPHSSPSASRVWATKRSMRWGRRCVRDGSAQGRE